MARRKRFKIKPEPTNTLSTLLEEGKPIVGLVGFVPIEYTQQEDEDATEIFVKVKVVGVKVDGCNVKVLAELLSGKGRILISPCQFVDNVKTITDRRERASKIAKAHRDFKAIGKSYYHHHRVKSLEEYVKDNMSPDQQQAFHEGVKDETNKQLKKVAKHELVKLAAVACLVVNGVEGEDTENNYNWRW